ncbi:hypothetical protein OHW01_13785 [Acinetobacter baumannii]|uniref:hypothetical protein n=1 Tax=Acinetobacter baumannii TaxID=470 RepID=UPI000BBB737D|nr:hypothetical protein [Acinetobacter baumannii]MDC4814549.1 hypothetical protein [Acinetobacter baumannii]MDC4882446.1 hypothetical protein [Acinetobacter baumannii]MDC4889461.1 hypothetical protein [Acinetobacter baumannii]MDC4904341.1 hypothetical protein [Acinetobacter baumannii]MDC4911993.1 hypothetical protein [Acinetobacter baumannii]
MIKRFLGALSVFFLMLLIAYIYIDYVVVVYDYWFVANDIVISGLFFFYIFPLVISFFMRQSIHKPSDFLSWIYFFLVLLPSIALAPYVASDFYTGAFTNAMVLVVNISLIFVGLINENKIIPYFKGVKDKAVVFIVLIFTLFFTVLLSLNYNFNISKVLDLTIFTDTYLIRDEFREAKSDSSGLAGYAIFWLAKVFLPFFICYGLAFKNKTFLIFGVIMQIVIFSVSAHKSFVFSVLLIFAVYGLLVIRASFYQWIIGLFSLTLFSVFLYRVLQIPFIIDVIIRRSLIVPGVLTHWWVNFFSVHNFVLFKNTFLGNFFDSSYSLAAPFLIGQYYFGSEWTSANVNFAIDAYGNGGILAFLLTLCALLFLLLVINKFSQGSDGKKIFIVLLAVPTFWSFIETSFISVMVTHGLFWAILIVLFFRKS